MVGVECPILATTNKRMNLPPPLQRIRLAANLFDHWNAHPAGGAVATVPAGVSKLM
jgi:hypothetical protein